MTKRKQGNGREGRREGEKENVRMQTEEGKEKGRKRKARKQRKKKEGRVHGRGEGKREDATEEGKEEGRKETRKQKRKEECKEGETKNVRAQRRKVRTITGRGEVTTERKGKDGRDGRNFTELLAFCLKQLEGRSVVLQTREDKLHWKKEQKERVSRHGPLLVI